MTNAIYVRTSPGDNDGAAQLHELREWAKSQGWRDVAEYVDRDVSGTKDSRPAWDRLIADVRARRVRAWAATELARLGRGGVLQLAPFLGECQALGTRVVVTRMGLDYATPGGRFVANVMMEFYKMEREVIVERVRAGVRRAQARGTRSGRPIGRPRRFVDVPKARAALAAGASWRAAAAAQGVGLGTIRRALGACQNPAAKSG